MKVCKFLWRRALVLLLAGLCLGFLLLGYLSADGASVQQRAVPTDGRDHSAVGQAVVFVGETILGLYVRQNSPQAGLRSIKVVNEDYVRSQTRRDSQGSDGDNDYNRASDIIAPEEDEESEYQSDSDDFQDSPNREFQAGDFDYEIWQAENGTGTAEAFASSSPTEASTSVNQVTENNIARTEKPFRTPFQSVLRVSRPVVTLRTLRNESIVEDGIFWSSRLEALLPKGLLDEDVGKFLDKSRLLPVQHVEAPTWNRCGRPKNQYVVLSDGTQACARYRAPHDYLVQGEVMSFYLARLLGISNVPAVSLSPVSKWLQWKGLGSSLDQAGWLTNATVALIQWVDGLERDKMPKVVLDALKENRSLTPLSNELRSLTNRHQVELVQWSDLIVFDYITGNYDRVASMQDAADREQRPAVLQETIHNLVKSHQTQSLWLIDNESGLLDSYSLLYGQGSVEPNQKESRFVRFHKEMLNTMCIFRRETFQRVRWLRSMNTKAAKYLVMFIKKHEPLFKTLPSVFNNREFVTNFHRRIFDVYQHMKRCQVL